MEQNRAAVIAEAYRRWEQRDPTPLIPPFDSTKSKKKSPKGKSKHMKVTTYLNFPGTCTEALDFYVKHLGAKIL